MNPDANLISKIFLYICILVVSYYKENVDPARVCRDLFKKYIFLL